MICPSEKPLASEKGAALPNWKNTSGSIKSKWHHGAFTLSKQEMFCFFWTVLPFILSLKETYLLRHILFSFRSLFVWKTLLILITSWIVFNFLFSEIRLHENYFVFVSASILHFSPHFFFLHPCLTVTKLKFLKKNLCGFELALFLSFLHIFLMSVRIFIKYY